MAAVLLITGCTAGESSGPASSGSDSEVHTVIGDAEKMYIEYTEKDQSCTSRTAAVQSMYKMHFSDDTYDTYSFDGVLEENSDTAHLTENIHSNGMTSFIEGWYYGGTLYNTYNGITYYEKMSMQDIEKTMLVQLSPFPYAEGIFKQIEVVETGAKDRIFHLYLKEDTVKDLFRDRYDFYDLSTYDSFAVKDHVITVMFDKDGKFVRETSKFETEFTYGSEKIETVYTSEVNVLKYDQTEVTVTDEMKKEQSAYVSYEDIDTSSITPETSDDDTAEETATGTFRKRLKSRLSYTEQSEGVYTAEFNDHESYQVDFNNNTFMYSNYSIRYTYSWKGDIGSMGVCTYDFKSGQASSECTDSVLETLQQARSYLQIELYYCGLSLEDLQEESK